MKRKTFLLLIYLILSEIVFCQNLTKKYLISGKWGQESGYFFLGTYFKFIENKVILSRNTMSGKARQEQKYEIKDNKLIIPFNSYWESSGKPNCSLIYSLKKSDTSFYFEDYLLLENANELKKSYGNLIDDLEKVWNHKTPVKGDITRTINGIKVIRIFKKGATTDNLKVRNKPDISGTPYIFYNSMEDKSIPYLNKGTEIKVLGRTETKVKVKNWENYWYYVKFYPDPVTSIYLEGQNPQNTVNEEADFWVFGEFVKILEDLKIEEIPEEVFNN